MASVPQTVRLRTPARPLAPVIAFVRRHAVFLSLMGAGLALRIVTTAAYSPAFLINDSEGFLSVADHLVPDEFRPAGYSFLIWALPDHLSLVAAVQHLMGLATGVLIYALLNRLGVPRWGSALAAAPVLLDAYQLDLEHFILTEASFELLVVGGCAALLWWRRPGPVAAGTAGLLFALTALTRANGIVAIVPALIALACLRWKEPWRAVAPAFAALLVTFCVPVAGYAAWYHHHHGKYAVSGAGGHYLYGRVSPFADCTKVSVPPEEARLCPAAPPGHRPTLAGSTAEYYMWSADAPIWKGWNGSVKNIARLEGSFAKRVIRHQPLDYARAVSHDFLRAFAPVHSRGKGELWIARWRFPLDYRYYTPYTARVIRDHGGGTPHVNRGLAHFLRGYQRYVYTFGPILAVGLLVGFLAAAGVGRARRSGLRTAAFLFASMGVVVFGSTVLANQFSWRYQLVLIVLLPAAAALGLTALLRRPAP